MQAGSETAALPNPTGVSSLFDHGNGLRVSVSGQIDVKRLALLASRTERAMAAAAELRGLYDFVAFDRADAVVVLGGDGFMLHTLHRMLDKGRISQQGSPLELYNRPANKFVASFIGSPAMNFFRAEVKGQQGKDIELTLPGGKMATIASRGGALRAGGVQIGVRPEHVKIGPAGNGSAFDGAPGAGFFVLTKPMYSSASSREPKPLY